MSLQCFYDLLKSANLKECFIFLFRMGCFGSKDKLSKEDMDFLKSHTRYDETTIKEWYKGFKVINVSIHCKLRNH